MTLTRSTYARDALLTARRLADASQTRDALAVCDSLLRDQPGCIEARLLSAALALSLGLSGQALDDLDAATWYLQHETSDADHQLAIEQLLLRGKALLQSARPDEACTVWRQVLALRPRHPGALHLLAGAYEQLKQYDQAIACVEHLLLLKDHRETDDLRMLIDLCESDGQYERALSLLEQYGLSDEPVTQWQMVRLLRHVDRKHEAMDRLTRLCRQWPDDLSLALAAAELAGQLGHESVMLHHAGHALADRAAQPGAIAAFAMHAQRIGQFAQAGRQWWRLSGLSPADAPNALAQLAVCATVMNRDRLAGLADQRLKRLAGETRSHSLLAAAWMEMTPGRLMLEQQQGPVANALGTEQSVLSMLLHEAAATLELQAEQKPGYADVHHHLSVCQWKLGQADRAALNSDRALHINTGYAQAAILRARLLVEEGAAEAALAVLNAALSSKPDHLELSAMAGALEVMTHRWKQALSRLTAKENKPLLRQRIGQWLEQLGRDNEAIQWRNAA